MNTKIRQHPLMILLQSNTIEDMTNEKGNHPFMLDLTGEKEMSDEDATAMINQLINQFNLTDIQKV